MARKERKMGDKEKEERKNSKVRIKEATFFAIKAVGTSYKKRKRKIP